MQIICPITRETREYKPTEKKCCPTTPPPDGDETNKGDSLGNARGYNILINNVKLALTDLSNREVLMLKRLVDSEWNKRKMTLKSALKRKKKIKNQK